MTEWALLPKEHIYGGDTNDFILQKLDLKMEDGYLVVKAKTKQEAYRKIVTHLNIQIEILVKKISTD